MTFGLPTVQYDVDPRIAKILDMLFVLHADHEQNCSTNVMRGVGSSRADPYVAVAGVAQVSDDLDDGPAALNGDAGTLIVPS